MATTTTETSAQVGAAHNIWDELVFAFIGVAALAIIADLNDRLGQALEALMIGFVVMWFLMHSDTINGWINKYVPETSGGASGGTSGGTSSGGSSGGGTSGSGSTCPAGKSPLMPRIFGNRICVPDNFPFNFF